MPVDSLETRLQAELDTFTRGPVIHWLETQPDIIIGDGPDGDARAHQVHQAVTTAMVNPPRMIEIHVNDGQYQITRPSELRTEPATVPEPRPETLLAGNQGPARSEADLQTRYDPLPEPSYSRFWPTRWPPTATYAMPP